MRGRVGSCFLRVGIEFHVDLRGEAGARERSVDGAKRREHASESMTSIDDNFLRFEK